MLTKTEICSRSWDTALTDQTVCFGRTVAAFELLAGKALECSELMGLFCRNLEDNAKCTADNEELACQVLERSFENLSDSIRITHVIQVLKSCFAGTNDRMLAI